MLDAKTLNDDFDRLWAGSRREEVILLSEVITLFGERSAQEAEPREREEAERDGA